MKEIKFGTEGWRGVIADDFTFENVSAVSLAIVNYLKNIPGDKKIIIGYDHRFAGESFSAIISGIFSGSGYEVKVADSPVTTPNICYSVKSTGSLIGIMVTASHNPPKFNGIKIKAKYGGPIPEWVGKEIEKEIGKINNDQFSYEKTVGKIELTDIKADYISYIGRCIDLDLIKKGKLTAVIDYSHGSGSGYIEKILNKVSKDIIYIRNTRDPLFGGRNPEPIEENLSLLKSALFSSRASIGIALDGDGDRVGIIDDKGRYLPPHTVFPLILNYLVGYRKRRGKVAQTISLGYLSERIARKHNLDFEETSVGFKNICDLMLKENIIAGGEESGGYAFEKEIPDRDGILSGLIFLEMMAYTGKKLSSLVDELQKEYGKSFFKREDIQLPEIIFDKKSFVDKISGRVPGKLLGFGIKDVRKYDGIKIVLENDSWLLMRPSGTEPKLRIYSEASSSRNAGALVELGKKLVLKQ